MKSICVKAIVPVTLAVTGFVIICCILLYSAISSDMTGNAVHNASNLADTIVKSTSYTMLRDDRETMRNIIGNIGEQEGIEHVRIFNKKGLIMFSGDPKELDHFVDKNAAGCLGCHEGPVPTATLDDMRKARRFVNGKHVEVLAITSPIYNAPACFNAACHVHPPEQKVLGTLDIGLDETPHKEALSVMRGRMIIFSLMVLLLTVGGVAALLMRNVFLPIDSLIGFTESVVNGNLKAEFPKAVGELQRLAGNFRKMAARLKKSEERLAELKRMEHGSNREECGRTGPQK